MAHAPYTTSTYPYPAAMWDEAAEHLKTPHRGWTTTLLVNPNPTEACSTAKSEMTARGVENTTCLIFDEPFADAWIIRISKLKYIDPRWDEIERKLKDVTKKIALVSIDTEQVSADAVIDMARAAMAERGLTVSIGYSYDPSSAEGLIRVEAV